MMKKQVYTIILALIALGVTSCQKEETVASDLHAYTLDRTVLHEDWDFDEETMQFYYHFDIQELTEKVYDYGNWTICREFNKGDKNAYQVALPMSVFCTDTLEDSSVAYYTQHIDYRLGVGWLEIQLTNSDYWYPTTPDGKLVNPEDMYFRIQLIY